MSFEILVGTNGVPGICTLLGGFVLFFGFVSLIIKEWLYLSESLLATLIGVLFGPYAINLMDLGALGVDVSNITFQFAQIVIAIQIINASITLPNFFWKTNWKALFILYVPVMIYMWLSTALLVWLILGLEVWDCMIVAACLAPTDPVLANSIINGKFADMHVPIAIRWLLSGESAGNDGAGLPFFALGVQFLRHGTTSEALKYWFLQTILYEIGCGIVLGAVIGYTANMLLKISEGRGWIDKRSFLSFEIALALFTVGLATILDVASFLAVFATGLVFAWDGRFTEETAEAHVQEVIDSLVNLTFFVYYGSIIPWTEFNTALVPIGKLVGFSIAVLIIRRMPIITALHRWLPPLMTIKEVGFYGWFGPIGVGALWYAALFRSEFPEKAYIVAIVDFVVLSSVVAHGMTLPLFQMTVMTLSTISARRDIRAPSWPMGIPITTDIISSPISRPDLPRNPADEKHLGANGDAPFIVGSADTVNNEFARDSASPTGSAIIPIEEDDIGGVPMEHSNTQHSVAFGIPLTTVGRTTSNASATGSGILKNVNWIGPIAGDGGDESLQINTIMNRSSYENAMDMPPGGFGIPLSRFDNTGMSSGGFANLFGRRTRITGFGGSSSNSSANSDRQTSPRRRPNRQSEDDGDVAVDRIEEERGSSDENGSPERQGRWSLRTLRK
ncbi:hypothetical protein SmJEL517_g04861 [Synchytrium microbalum]|uniref:Cation/H+ exchanger transmembrane domain-containing protein n=1 Tax=Synchytrium microbalum TaxID=1806994 RepID=A0A507BPT7_9FUNG|nr:uncharacterized protein SmJEL517_g04861 [Synchytrium microbalum]TPX31940.1 hypothetical protein SmJEL517_g04861 [Synchytrium microbalum]